MGTTRRRLSGSYGLTAERKTSHREGPGVEVGQAPVLGRTARYASPEQHAGKGIGPASDIFSWAVMIQELMQDSGAVAHEALTAFLSRCLDTVPEHRPATDDARAAMRRLYEDITGTQYPRAEIAVSIPAEVSHKHRIPFWFAARELCLEATEALIAVIDRESDPQEKERLRRVLRTGPVWYTSGATGIGHSRGSQIVHAFRMVQKARDIAECLQLDHNAEAFFYGQVARLASEACLEFGDRDGVANEQAKAITHLSHWSSNAETAITLYRIEAARRLAIQLSQSGDHARAMSQLTQVSALCERFGETVRGEDEAALRELRAKVHHDVAVVLRSTGRSGAAELENAMALMRCAAERGQPFAPVFAATLEVHHANELDYAGRHDEAIAIYRSALRRYDAMPAMGDDERFDQSSAFLNLGLTLMKIGGHGEAERQIREVVKIRTEIVRGDSGWLNQHRLAYARQCYGQILYALGRHRDAERELNEAGMMWIRLVEAGHKELFQFQFNLALMLVEIGQSPTSERERSGGG